MTFWPGSWRIPVLLLCLVLAGCSVAQRDRAGGGSLRTPFDVAGQRAVWGQPAVRHACATPPALLAGATQQVDRWWRGRPVEPAAAACALAWLDAAASADRAPGDADARRDLLAGLALAWLKLADAPGLDLAASARVTRWLQRMAATVQPPFERADARRPETYDAEAYRTAMAVMAAAVAAQDRRLWDWGLFRARWGLGEVNEDGALPLELARGKGALAAHAYATASLVLAAELAAANGVDLYSEKNSALHRLARRTLDGLDDQGYFAARTGELQDMAAVTPWLGWIEPYFARFPEQARPALLARLRPLVNPALGGDLTLTFGRPL